MITKLIEFCILLAGIFLNLFIGGLLGFLLISVLYILKTDDFTVGILKNKAVLGTYMGCMIVALRGSFLTEERRKRIMWVLILGLIWGIGGSVIENEPISIWRFFVKVFVRIAMGSFFTVVVLLLQKRS